MNQFQTVPGLRRRTGKVAAHRAFLKAQDSDLGYDQMFKLSSVSILCWLGGTFSTFEPCFKVFQHITEDCNRRRSLGKEWGQHFPIGYINYDAFLHIGAKVRGISAWGPDPRRGWVPRVGLGLNAISELLLQNEWITTRIYPALIAHLFLSNMS